jgi:RsiW-degrading membrane proteinase PrsW (M82 family)
VNGFTLKSLYGRIGLFICFVILVFYFNNLFYSQAPAIDYKYFLVAPIVEESFRALSIIIGFPILYTAGLSLLEFWMKIEQYYSAEWFDFDYVLIRIICIVVHFIFLSIQLTAFSIAKKYDKSWIFFIGILSAIAAHFLWNSQVSILVISLIFS